jgi:hypothetical protein
MLILLCVALVAWLLDPFAALLLVPAVHLGLIAAARRGRALALAGLGASLIPVVLLLLVYGHELGLSPPALAESAALALAGGQVGPLAALLWSAAFGAVLALLAHALAPAPAQPARERIEISTRGPLSYAGPGSLGGTESALRQ